MPSVVDQRLVSEPEQSRPSEMKGTAALLLFAVTLSRGAIINRKECSTDGPQMIPHENCNQYYQCIHGAFIVRNCSSILYFNPETEECDWPANVDCGNEEDLNDPVSTCSSGKGEGLFFVHDNCNQYYWCVHGNLLKYSCDPNLVFNHETLRCDWPDNVDCKGSTLSPGTDAPTTESDKPDVETTPSPDNCQDSCEDKNDSSNEDSSEEGSNEQSSNQTDSNEDDSNTDNSNEDTSNENISSEEGDVDDSDEDDSTDENSNENDSTEDVSNETDVSKVCAAENSDGVLVPHEDCSKFYKCSEGKPVVMNCPSDLLFNPDTEQCDWPNNVDCGKDGKPFLKKKLVIAVDVSVRGKKLLNNKN